MAKAEAHVKKALFLAPNLEPRGTSEYTVQLAHEMCEQGVEVSVFCGPGPMVAALERSDVPVRVFEHLQSPRWHPRMRAELEDTIAGHGADIVHVHSGKLLSVINSLDFDRLPPMALTLHWLPGRRRPLRRLSPGLAGIIATTQGVREGLVNEAGLDRSKVTVIPNGVDVARIEAGRVPPIFRSEMPVVGSLGPVEEKRGHELFVEAVARLVREGVEAQFVVAGMGAEVPGIRKLVKQRGLEKRVTMACDLLAYDDVLDALDVVVQASQVDVSGFSILSPMAYRRAVIAFNTGTACDIVKDGKTGLLVPKGDVDALGRAVRSLVDDPARAHELARQAHQQVTERHDIRNVCRDTLQFYARLLSS
jgi:glycosyltransferase involved in cell wall biosynthesis